MYLSLHLHLHLLPRVNRKRKYKHKAKNAGSIDSMLPQDGVNVFRHFGKKTCGE